MEEHGMYFGKKEFYQIIRDRKPNYFRQRITDIKKFLLKELSDASGGT